MTFKIVSFFLVCFFFYPLSGQVFTSNNTEIEEIYERLQAEFPSEKGFSGAKPYNYHDINREIVKLYEGDSNFSDGKAEAYLVNELNRYRFFSEKQYQKGKSATGIFYPNEGTLAGVASQELFMKLNPVLDIKMGREQDGSSDPYTLTRGAEISGSIGTMFSFYTLLTENQLRPFQYVRSYANGFFGMNSYTFNPQYTYWKDIGSNTAYDFSNAIGMISFRPSDLIQFAFGHDRNHYGFGYRSLFLSDHGAPYLQLKVNANFWKFHYQLLFAQLTAQYERGADQLLPKKYGAFHLLSLKPSSKLELGFYEGVIFNRKDGYDFQYLNPVIFYRSIEHSLGSPDNAMMGFQAKYQFLPRTQLYGQILLDDIQLGEFAKGSGWWGNKYGIQLGLKSYHILGINGLQAQLEFNAVRPYTYSHFGDSGTVLDNFSHYNQTLAHPYGANFTEGLVRLRYQASSRLTLEAQCNMSARGFNQDSFNQGANIFDNVNGNTLPRQYGNTIVQGQRHEILHMNLQAQYMLLHNLFLDLNVFTRNIKIEENESMNQIGLQGGLRMNFKRRDQVF